MFASDQTEELIGLVASLDRQTLIQQMGAYHGNFPLDFTPQFLEGLSLDRLRHIFLAVCLQNQRMPQIDDASVLESVG
jgi:hypothetical protein